MVYIVDLRRKLVRDQDSFGVIPVKQFPTPWVVGNKLDSATTKLQIN